MALASIKVPPPAVPTAPTLGQKLPLDFSLTVPGGTQISLPTSFGPTSDCRLIVDYALPSITLALAPFGFIFCMADVLLKVKAALDAVPDTLSNPPDPAALVTPLDDLATAIACITGAIPTISLPQLLKDIIDYLTAMLDCVIQTISSLQVSIDNIDSALAGAKNGTDLESTLQQARVQQLALVEQMNVQLNPLQPIFAVVTVMLGLIGAGSISFSQPSPNTSAADLVTALTTLKATLATLKGTLP